MCVWGGGRSVERSGRRYNVGLKLYLPNNSNNCYEFFSYPAMHALVHLPHTHACSIRSTSIASTKQRALCLLV